MNELILTLDEDLVQAAFRRVDSIWTVSKLSDSSLYSASSAVDAAVTEAWQKMEDVLGECLRAGWASVENHVSEVVTYVKDAASKLGNKANQFREILLAKLRAVISATFDLVLSTMRSEVKVGDSTYRLKSVNLQQKLVFSGSLESSLTALCKFVSSGELVVQGAYEAPTALPG
jgi:hypothetical protein